MAITDEDVRRVATLSRLALSDEEIADSRRRLTQILTYMERLAEVDVEGVEPAPYPFEVALPLREDDPAPGMTNDELMANAPEGEDGLIVVPRVIP